MHKCIKCEVELTDENWYKHLQKGIHVWHICKECHREKMRKWKNKRSKKEKLEYNRKERARLKSKVFGHYSKEEIKCQNPNCAVPGGMRDIRALTIDHLYNNGTQHRKKIGGLTGMRFYYWLKRNNYPEGFQILCMNCQLIKRFENDYKKVLE